jgi:formylglycine-generating enzyme required for sulfatase activity
MKLVWIAACCGLFLGTTASGGANPAPAPKKLDGPNAHKLVAVAAGKWHVGEKGHDLNPPRHVELKAYLIADAETTNAQFAKFVEATGYVTDAERRGSAQTFRKGEPEWKWPRMEGSNWKFPFGPDGAKAADQPEHPVTQISAADAAAYCKWLGGRLPTLEEWEVAARAGSTTRFPWGAEFDVKAANVWNGVTHARNTKEDGWELTAPVRSFPANAWGLHDVIGNVFEYCTGLPRGVAQREDHPLTAARGGSWWCSNNTCKFFNLVDIGTMELHGSLPNQGFRIVFNGASAPSAPATSSPPR